MDKWFQGAFDTAELVLVDRYKAGGILIRLQVCQNCSHDWTLKLHTNTTWYRCPECDEAHRIQLIETTYH